jgi:hypothetical protein
MGERIQRPLGLAKLEREPGAVLLAGAGVVEPQQHRAGRFGRRRGPAADLEHPPRADRAHGERDAPGGHPRTVDRRGQGGEVLARDAAVGGGQVGQPRRDGLETEIAQQLGVDLDAQVRPHDQGPRRG